MVQLFLLCGKPGCGKTTISNHLQEKYGMIGLSADDFMLRLFGEIEDRSEFEDKLKRTKEVIYSLSEKLMKNGMKVVLDFGFWTERERGEVRKRFEGFNLLFVFIDKNQEEIFKNVEKRNSNLKENEYYMDKQVFEILCAKFEQPCEKEDVAVINGSTKEEVDAFIQKYL